MSNSSIDQFASEDRLQKTWIPEGTEEYKEFKHVTLENNFLGNVLKQKFPLAPGDLLLDVGGREGDIGLQVQLPEYFHLIDPDPTLKLPFTPARYWQEKIQDVEIVDSYKLIICSHVLGYLGAQQVQSDVFRKLVKALAPNGTLVIFYNTNAGYMGELLKFSREILLNGHYDYFDENLLDELHSSEFEISHQDISFSLDYPSYEKLARCCWFLFGATDQDIDGVAAKFLSKLENDLTTPTFQIEERITFIIRKN